MLTFLRGIQCVLDAGHLSTFRFGELEQVLCGLAFRPWSLAGSWANSNELYSADRKLAELRDACHADHGYTAASTAVQRLYQILSSYYDREHQRVPVLRHGVPQPYCWRFARCIIETARFYAHAGPKALRPRLTVVCKGGYGDDPDAELTSMVTCQNYLKLPNYSSLAATERKLAVAIAEGQGSSHLS